MLGATKLMLAAMAIAAPLCVARAQASGAAPDAARATEAANKRLVLAMWHDVVDGRNIAHAPRYIAADYVQHSPGIGQGRAALMAFLEKEFDHAAPRAAGTYPLTNFVFVLADGDLVQLMFQRPMADPRDKAKTIKVWWYDTYRVRSGQIVEHWDSALG